MAILTDSDIAKFDGSQAAQQPQVSPKVLTDDDIAQHDQANPSLKEMFRGEMSDAQGALNFANTGLLKSATGKGFQDRAIEANAPNIPQAQSRPFDANVTAAEQPGAQAASIAKMTAAGSAGTVEDQLSSPVGLALAGAKPIEAGLNAAKDAAGDVSARIGDWMVKLPQKSFAYSKDPMSVLTKEKVTGNSITDLADNYSQRLSERNQQLDEAMKSSKSNISIGSAVDSHIEDAAGKLTGSLRDRTHDQAALQTMKENLEAKYGDLNNLPVQKAIQLKRQLAADYPFTRENSTDVVANAAHKIYHTIDSAVDIAEPKIADLNQRVSGLIDISKAAKNRSAIEARQNPIGFIGSLVGLGTAGAVGHGAEGAGAGLASALALKAASSPAVLSRVAKGLSMLSEGDKIQLYKASPQFMDFVSEAEKQPAWTAAMAGKVGKGAGISDAEIVKPEEVSAIEYKKPLLRGDRALPAPSDAGQSSGPVVEGQPQPKLPSPVRRPLASQPETPDVINGENPIKGIPNLSQIKEGKGFTMKPNQSTPDISPEASNMESEGGKTIGPNIFNKEGKIDTRGLSKDDLNNQLEMTNKYVGTREYKSDSGYRQMIDNHIKELKDAIKEIGGGPLGITAATGAATAATMGAMNSNAMASRFKPGHTFTGEASTYGWGEKLNPKTADGTLYDKNNRLPFVAMRNVPLGSTVEVKDLKSGKVITVPVKDFGPGQRTGRVVDLSNGAWRQLGYSRPGLSNVKVTVKTIGNGHSYHGKY